MKREFRLLQEYIQFKEKENLKVSKSNIGWHVYHSLKVINTVFEALKNSNPLEYKKGFNALRLLAFALGSFPRGKAKSPKRVLPPEIILQEGIENQLDLAIKNIEDINKLDKNHFFIHPLFKQLNKKKSLKFLRLHTNHHLKIISDILK